MLKNMPSMHKRMLGILPKGMNNVKPLSYIANTLNIDFRQANALINELSIKYGIPIGSIRYGERPGVFIPLNNDEKTDRSCTTKKPN
ncbi:hypothetical protein SAMN04488558_1122 [Ignavigranum ruoffiae]|uniref:Uncharacterized protein n=1 Tax=Ignavigranum ruoffiae TaxID=89093 RepID=A0A1H9G803_9LACT|nr:hypothetical protein [Ignavigranum ruoffiae]SEQ46247.1 hypothetical protein SAMN04488558_1122 [Ignavigranum ruoffiae]